MSNGAQRLIVCEIKHSGLEASRLKFLHAGRHLLGISEGSNQVKCLASVETYQNQGLNHYVLLKIHPGTELYFWVSVYFQK